MRFSAVKIVLALAALAIASIVVLYAPAERRLQYGLFVVSAPLALCTIFVKPQFGLLLVAALGGVFSPSIALGSFAEMYLHQYVILLSVAGMAAGAVVFRAGGGAGRGGAGFPLLIVAPALSLCASFLIAPDLKLAAKTVLFVGVFFCSYYLAANALRGWGEVRRLLRFLLGGAAVAALAALIGGGFAFGSATTGFLTNPNAMGSYLGPIATLWLALELHRVRLFRSAALNFAGLGAVLLALLLTVSRASWLGCACGTLYAVYKTRRLRLWMLVLPLVVGAAIWSVGDYDPLLEKLDPEGSGKYGVLYRWQKIEMALEMFGESPLVGNGPGSFQCRAEASRVALISNHTTLECTYPYILAEYGLMGAAAWACLALLVYGAWRRNTRRRGCDKETLNRCLAAVLLGFLISQGGENTLFFPKTNWLPGFLLGLLFALRRLEDDSQGELEGKKPAA